MIGRGGTAAARPDADGERAEGGGGTEVHGTTDETAEKDEVEEHYREVATGFVAAVVAFDFDAFSSWMS